MNTQHIEDVKEFPDKLYLWEFPYEGGKYAREWSKRDRTASLANRKDETFLHMLMMNECNAVNGMRHIIVDLHCISFLVFYETLPNDSFHILYLYDAPN